MITLVLDPAEEKTWILFWNKSTERLQGPVLPYFWLTTLDVTEHFRECEFSATSVKPELTWAPKQFLIFIYWISCIWCHSLEYDWHHFQYLRDTKINHISTRNLAFNLCLHQLFDLEERGCCILKGTVSFMVITIIFNVCISNYFGKQVLWYKADKDVTLLVKTGELCESKCHQPTPKCPPMSRLQNLDSFQEFNW